MTRGRLGRTAIVVAASLFAFVASASAYEGFGAETPGGAGKTIVKVTNLNDSGAGSLREALAGGNRTIVFAVGGTINLLSKLALKGSYVTVDGLTAPSPGITLRNAGLTLSGTTVHNVIIRGIRIRQPGVNDSSGDGLSIKYGAHHIVVDHVSIDGCGDGNLDVTKGAHDVTISWSVFSSCLKNMLVKYSAERVSLHHNAFVSSQYRNPYISNENDGSVAQDTTVDLRNNLVWGWGNEGGGTGVECGA